MKRALAVLATTLALLTPPTQAVAELPPLLPRQLLFRNPEAATPRISPNGLHLVWIAPTNQIPNLWVRQLQTNQPTARLLSLDPRGSIRQPTWQSDSQAVLYLQDADGAGTLHLMQAHVPSGTIRDLTPFTGVQARLIATSPRFSNEILVAMNLRHRRWFDAYRVDLHSGAITPEAENPGDVTTWYADQDLNLRLAQVVLPSGDLALATRSDPRSVWRPLLRWGAEDTLDHVYGFGPGGSNVFLVSSVGTQAARLLSIDLTTGNATALAQDARSDISGALFHPASNLLEAAQFSRARAQWQFANSQLLPDFQTLRKFNGGDLDVLSRDHADRFWTVSYTSADAPIRFALYERSTQTVTPLFSEHPDLDPNHLASTRSIRVSARDGLALEGYLTLPRGLEPKKLPAVLLVHGGPWSRVLWSFDPRVHWLANRGYAVLQINTRGSTGYGKEFLNAGNKEWGGKMLLDLADAKTWAADQGFIDPKRTAIMGTGFGGYAALASLARHPDLFTAGISIGGPPDLTTMIRAVPPTATHVRTLLDRRVGSLTHDSPLLIDQSPVSRATSIRAPLLVVATGHDPQAPASEMDAFIAAIRREGRNIDYLLFPDEGAVIRHPANQLRLYAAAEAFLARHLQGRAEPPSATEQFESLRR